ncbi:MAG: GDP-mannose dehydrogenase, partial [Gammaproteobacteria bacterium]|nr:GDP-mannose dehydrogenase [Gammaproteobacteria bacterium]
NQIPHISRLMVDSMEHALDHAGTIVIGNGDDEFKEALQKLPESKVLIDLVRIIKDVDRNGRYEGICW